MSETQECPKCGTEVAGAGDFGMTTCLHCGEVVMLGTRLKESSEQLPPEDEIVIIEPLRPLPENVPAADASESFADVAEFGNRQLPATGTGALVYDIQISGVDTAEIRDDVRDCLKDPRLHIDVAQIISEIKSGELRLNDLNPVKASVILGKIRHLPIKVSWTSKQLVKAVIALVVLGSLSARSSEWARHEVNLNGYMIKLNNGEDDIRQLIAKKKQSKDAKERDELLNEIIKKNDDLRKVYKDLKSEEAHIRFEHPEEGDKTERKYRHVRLKSIEELEEEVGLDGQLTRLKKKVEQKYQ